MKKVGVVSCYYQHNYGSMLQAYATQAALDELNIDNETIDISGFKGELNKVKIKYFIKQSLVSDILIHKYGRALNMLIKKIGGSTYKNNIKLRDRKFSEFSDTHFRLSEQFGSLTELSDKCAEKYGSVLVGSDQLWLPVNIAADYFTLNFVPENVNTAAYATSFGQSRLPKSSEEKARIFLNKIRHISVREESGKKIVEDLTGRDVPVVCDPTLLFTGSDWLRIQNDIPLLNGSYIFCYFLGKNPLHRDFAVRLKKKTKCRIAALVHIDEFVKSDIKYADETPYEIGPTEFLNLIKNARYICTDSFHCTAFSILFHKDFFTFRRFSDRTKQSTNSRLETLFNITGISDRLIKGDEDIVSCLNIQTDFNMSDIKLDKVRQESFSYLESALKKENVHID